MLLRNDVDIERIQERLGHANAQTTMLIYLHPTKDDVRAATDRLPYSNLAQMPQRD